MVTEEEILNPETHDVKASGNPWLLGLIPLYKV
jgi:hypothetical protein